MLSLISASCSYHTAPPVRFVGSRVGAVRMDGEKEAIQIFDDLSEGQIYGPTKPAHAWPKPWTNLESQARVSSRQEGFERRPGRRQSNVARAGPPSPTAEATHRHACPHLA